MASHLPISAVKRTEGDGMENIESDDLKSHSTLSKISEQDVRESSKTLISLKPVVLPKRKISNPILDMKEPKFVPYEPYKAAVRPIVPRKKTPVLKQRIRANVRQQTDSSDSNCKEKNIELSVLPEKFANNALEEELIKLKLDNEELEKQLKLEVQVNGELKHLLVAAVGEDMETRVSSLTLDKFHLAQALLKSAKTLSTHQEQVEWLAGQCEVWRSKFLASSVMVEELARWKASLSHNINERQDLIKGLLEERECLRSNLCHVYDNLVLLRDSFDLHSKRVLPQAGHNLELVTQCVNISDGLVIQLLGGAKSGNVSKLLPKCSQLTEAEKAADYMLKNPHPLRLIGEADAACNAVMGAAVAVSGHLYHYQNPTCVSSCPKCTGQTKLV